MKTSDMPLLLYPFPTAIIHADADAFFASVEQAFDLGAVAVGATISRTMYVSSRRGRESGRRWNTDTRAS